MTEEDEPLRRKGYGLDRTLALSDGVFAFAVTLLVLDLVVPALSPDASSMDLWQALSKEYISFLNYILSFFIAGVWWNGHHRHFEHIRGSNMALRWLNLFFLLWIALMPFFTKILDQYNNLQLSIILYAIDQAAAGTFLTLIWAYASDNHRLIDKDMKESTIRFAMFRVAIAPIFFIVSIIISFLNISAATWSWWGMIPTTLIVQRLERRSEKESQKDRKVHA
jgi:uncharacterized membrane protein